MGNIYLMTTIVDRRDVNKYSDLFEENEQEMETQKYVFTEKEEMDKKDLLSLEKEMIGVYISGHPLDKLKGLMEKVLLQIDHLRSILYERINFLDEKFEKAYEFFNKIYSKS